MSKDMLGSLVRASVRLSQPQVNLTIDVMNHFTGDNGAAWEAHIKGIMRAGLPNLLQGRASKLSILKPVNDNIPVDSITVYDPSGFKTRQGLWVSDEFHSRVGSKAKPVKDLGAITLSSFDLTKNAYDKVIKADPNMPSNHVFESESEFVAYIDQKIQKQANGEAGDLLNNGWWNIFYVAGCVVRVRWYSDGQEWGVDAWKLDDGQWRAGDRVFSRN